MTKLDEEIVPPQSGAQPRVAVERLRGAHANRRMSRVTMLSVIAALVIGALLVGGIAIWRRVRSRTKDLRDFTVLPVDARGGRVGCLHRAGECELRAASVAAMDRREVTGTEWVECVSAGACAAIPSAAGQGDRPVTEVSWPQARSYCQWRQGDLPGPGTWESVARGLGAHRYPWGEAPPDCARSNFRGCSDGPTPAMREPGATLLGFEDLAGNVAEWVLDDDSDFRVSSTPDGASWFVRGGSFRDEASAVTTLSERRASQPAADIGFRCAYPSSAVIWGSDDEARIRYLQVPRIEAELDARLDERVPITLTARMDAPADDEPAGTAMELGETRMEKREREASEAARKRRDPDSDPRLDETLFELKDKLALGFKLTGSGARGSVQLQCSENEHLKCDVIVTPVAGKSITRSYDLDPGSRTTWEGVGAFIAFGLGDETVLPELLRIMRDRAKDPVLIELLLDRARTLDDRMRASLLLQLDQVEAAVKLGEAAREPLLAHFKRQTHPNQFRHLFGLGALGTEIANATLPWVLTHAGHTLTSGFRTNTRANPPRVPFAKLENVTPWLGVLTTYASGPALVAVVKPWLALAAEQEPARVPEIQEAIAAIERRTAASK